MLDTIPKWLIFARIPVEGAQPLTHDQKHPKKLHTEASGAITWAQTCYVVSQTVNFLADPAPSKKSTEYASHCNGLSNPR